LRPHSRHFAKKSSKSFSWAVRKGFFVLFKKERAMNIVFLVMKDHPYGRVMLRHLMSAGIIPSCVIQEDSPIASVEKDKFLQRMGNLDVPPTIDELVGGLVSCYNVENHNNRRCMTIMEQYLPHWIVLGGTRIIRGRLLGYHMLNVHPGLLPWVRGSSAEAWSIYSDYPVGVTCHKVDGGVDTGPILLRQQLVVQPSDTYEMVVRANITLAAETMVRAVHMVESGKVDFITQNNLSGNTFPVMSPELLEEVRKKLVSGGYHPQTLLFE